MTPTPNSDRLAAFDKLDLLSGQHKPPEDEENCHACIMEARAWVYRVDWTDHPDFDSPGITAFLIPLNDNWPDKDRQRLKKYLGIPPTKASVEVERVRAVMCLDWFLREHQPLWLEAAGLAGQAAELRALPAVTESNVEAAMVTQKKALEDARAARDPRDARDAWAAWAVRDAAWDARDAWAAWAARDAAWAARDAWAAWDARDARDARAAVAFLVAARAGDALGKDATEQQRIVVGIAALDVITAKTRDAELVLLDWMLAL